MKPHQDVAGFRTRLRGLVLGGRAEAPLPPALRGGAGADLLTDLPRIDASRDPETLIRHGIHLLPCLVWQDGEDLVSMPLPAKALGDAVWQELADQAPRWRNARAPAPLEDLARALRHHLAAPLHSQAGLLEVLREASDPGAQFHRMLQVAQQSAQQLAASADRLAALMQIEQTPLDRGTLDLSALCAQWLAELRGRREGDVQIELSEGMTVWADPVALRLALQALLDNALKFSAGVAAPRLRVQVRRAPGHDLICVEDNGAGLAVEHAPALFRPFERIHLQSEFPGLGLGLALAQAVARRHQGGCWCDMGEPGLSIFVMALPRAPQPRDEARTDD